MAARIKSVAGRRGDHWILWVVLKLLVVLAGASNLCLLLTAGNSEVMGSKSRPPPETLGRVAPYGKAWTTVASDLSVPSKPAAAAAAGILPAIYPTTMTIDVLVLANVVLVVGNLMGWRFVEACWLIVYSSVLTASFVSRMINGRRHVTWWTLTELVHHNSYWSQPSATALAVTLVNYLVVFFVFIAKMTIAASGPETEGISPRGEATPAKPEEAGTGTRADPGEVLPVGGSKSGSTNKVPAVRDVEAPSPHYEDLH